VSDGGRDRPGERRVLVMMANPMSKQPRVARESRALQSRGVEVLGLGTLARGDEPRTEIVDGMRVRRIDLWDVRAVRALKRRRAVRRTPAPPADPTSAVPVSPVPPRRDLVSDVRTVLHWAAAAVQFTVHAARTRVAAYHPHDLPPLLPAVLLGAVRRRPVVYESHEYWSAKFPDRPMSRRLGRRIERLGCRRADLVLVVNDTIADRMALDFAIPRPVVVPNVTDIAPIARVAEWDGASPLEVLYHGIVVPGRGVEHLVDAVALMKHPARLVVRGPDESGLREALVERARRHGLGERFVYADPVPLSQLVEAAAGSHVGVMPFENRLGYEVALPNKLFEYMAAGLAVVSVDLPEIRRVIDEVGNGVLCTEISAKVLAAELDALAADPDRLAAYRHRSLDAARHRYNWDAQQHRLIDAYMPVLENGDRP